MTAAALAAILIPQLERAGRWLLPRLIARGYSKVVAFLEMRIDSFEDRIARIRKRKNKHPKARKARLAWLRWRIAWRRKLLAWMRKHESALTARALSKVSRSYGDAIEGIPWDAIGERFETWRRRRGGA